MPDDRQLLENMEQLGADKGQKVANLHTGAQLGSGYQSLNLDAATPIVFTPTFFVVMQIPTMYDDKPEMGRMIKTLFESHVKDASGIDLNYTIETTPQPIGHDGQEMEVPTQTKRAAVNPSFTFPEVTGNLVWNLFRKWMIDIHHPDTNAFMAGYDSKKPYTMSAYTMTMLAIQFDSTMLPENIIETSYYTNMFPKETGELGLQRSIGQSKTMDRTIPMSGIVQHNDYIRSLGKEIATKLNLSKLNYNKMKSGITAVNSSIEESGLNQQAQDALNNMYTG